MRCASSHWSRPACHSACSSAGRAAGGAGCARLARNVSRSTASVPEHSVALLVDDLTGLDHGEVVGAVRRAVGVGPHEAVLPRRPVDLLADDAGGQPLAALRLGGGVDPEALVLHRLAFLRGGEIGSASGGDKGGQYV